MVALGMQCVRGDNAPGEVEIGQQRPEPADLVGLAVHVDLAEDGAGLVVKDGHQVHGLPAGAGMAGAPHRLAVHGQRCPPPRAGSRSCLGWRSPGQIARPRRLSRASASTASRTRRIVASSGGLNRRVSGSRRIPSVARTDGGASATHSPIAVNDRDPASTAAIAAASSEHSEWRTPRGSRGSGTHARYSSRLGPGARPPAAHASPAGRPASCSRAGLIGDDEKAGTVFRRDHGTRQPHDLGNRACFASSRANRTPGQQPRITPLCRGPGVLGQHSDIPRHSAVPPR